MMLSGRSSTTTMRACFTARGVVPHVRRVTKRRRGFAHFSARKAPELNPRERDVDEKSDGAFVLALSARARHARLRVGRAGAAGADRSDGVVPSGAPSRTGRSARARDAPEDLRTGRARQGHRLLLIR